MPSPERWKLHRRRLRASLLLWRYRRELQQLRHYALFIGYPRSGHTLVAALLDAHPRMLFANGLDVAAYIRHGFSVDHVASLSIWNSLRFTRKGRRSNGFEYTVPAGFHGRWDALRVIGDKSGDLLSSRLVQEPGLIVDLMIEFAGRAKFIHVIRNPFDCISTMAARAGAALGDAVHEFFRLCEANQIARNFVPREAWEDVYLEELIQRPHRVVADLCRFLGQEAHNSYLSACSELVFSAPRRSRDGAAWPSGLVREIEDRLLGFPWLRGYSFRDSPFARARVEVGAARPETRPTELSLTLPP